MIFIKPDGREVFVNELSASYALELGWKPKDSVPVIDQIEPKRRGRPPKVKDDNDGSAIS